MDTREAGQERLAFHAGEAERADALPFSRVHLGKDFAGVCIAVDRAAVEAVRYLLEPGTADDAGHPCASDGS